MCVICTYVHVCSSYDRLSGRCQRRTRGILHRGRGYSYRPTGGLAGSSGCPSTPAVHFSRSPRWIVWRQLILHLKLRAAPPMHESRLCHAPNRTGPHLLHASAAPPPSTATPPCAGGVRGGPVGALVEALLRTVQEVENHTNRRDHIHGCYVDL